MAPRQMLRPTVGYWMVRLAKGAVEVPASIEIVHTTKDVAEPSNHMDGTRSPFMAAFIGGDPVAVDDVWLRRGRAISAEEYKFQLADHLYCRQHLPDDPKARPREKVDLRQVTIPF